MLKFLPLDAHLRIMESDYKYTYIKSNVLSYYKAEQREAVFMLLCGGIISGLALWGILFSEDVFWLSISYTVIPLSTLQFLSGVRNLIFVGKKRNRILNALKIDANSPVKEEKIRVLNTQIRLRFYRLIEQILFFVGFVFTFLGGVFGLSVFLAGSGIALMLKSAILFIQDLFAEWRTDIYLEELEIKE